MPPSKRFAPDFVLSDDGENKISRKLNVIPSDLPFVDGEELLKSCLREMVFEKIVRILHTKRKKVSR